MRKICLILTTIMLTGCAALPQLIMVAEEAAVEEVVELSVHHKTDKKDTMMNVQLESKEVKSDEKK